MSQTTIPRPPRLTANPSPVRRPGSIRRTSSIDVTWPGGMEGSRQMDGRARDLVTPISGGPGIVRAASTMIAMINNDRVIEAISASPAPAGLQHVVGGRGGGHLRNVLRENLPDLLAEASPLYLLLDDISGISLISSWVLALWGAFSADGVTKMDQAEIQAHMASRAGVCWGLKPGNSGVSPDHVAMEIDTTDAKELRNPLDPEGWHDLPMEAIMSMRRARRIDVWREAGQGQERGQIMIEAAFQDSANHPDGGRAALHEYIIRATVDPQTMVLTSLVPEPHVLPYHECPGAVVNAMTLVGTPIADMRSAVLEQLHRDRGCTHLNDALRSMAEVPSLLAFLDETLAEGAR